MEYRTIRIEGNGLKITLRRATMEKTADTISIKLHDSDEIIFKCISTENRHGELIVTTKNGGKVYIYADR